MSQKDDLSAGINWFWFTMRIPLVHTKISWPEFFQGALVGSSTCLILIPILTSSFGLNFEEAVAMTMVLTMLIYSSWLFFGEPYNPGYITPALPFVILLVSDNGAYSSQEKLQLMTAMSLSFAALLFFFGVTGLGAYIIKRIPSTLKNSIILGAGIAAFLRVFDLDYKDSMFNTQPVSATIATILALMLAFSAPLKAYARTHHWLRSIMGLGLLPAFAVGGIVGWLTGELTFKVEWGFFVPPVLSVLEKTSPFSIGWPSLDMFLHVLPFVLLTYTLFSGDLVTGDKILADGIPHRPDDKLTIHHSRTHLSVGIRNILMGITTPFFSTQGVLWTGIHAVIVQRWKEGPKSMRSLFDGLSSFSLLGIPILFFFLPLLTFMKPLMSLALGITLVLTGFICAYIALDKIKSHSEQGAVLMSAILLALLEPWQGLLAAVLVNVFIAGLDRRES